jgi:hypothetical protein
LSELLNKNRDCNCSKAVALNEKNYSMYEKKQTVTNTKTPDLSKMKAVVIDFKTVIYIEHGASEEEARKRYMTRGETFSKDLIKRKATTTK